MPKPLLRPACCIGGLLPLVLCLAAPPASAADNLSTLKQMSLDELADLRVSIATHRTERLEDTAAAVFVLTAEDIRRAGATTLPELLRTVPGLNVARISATEWAVSARGFNNQFANKLLVMVDGRSVYTPFFSGVLWDELNIVMQDIERIEVVRGPGGSTWGANAVNGVINILTRHAEDTQGSQVSVVAGPLQSELVARNGFKAGEAGFARVWAKAHQQDRLHMPADGDTADTRWRGGRAGFRGDWDLGSSTLMLEGETFREMKPDEREYSGAHLLGQWARTAGDSRDELRGYFNRFTLDRWAVMGNGAKAQLDTFDLSYRHLFAEWGMHSLIAGAGYRSVNSEAQMVPPSAVTRANRTDQLLSAFAEDTLSLAERLKLTLGVKVEDNDYTGIEWQPSARLRWTLGTGGTLWASVARAVRTPSIIEDSARFISFVAPSRLTGGLPMSVTSNGSAQLNAEKLTAYEMGYRIQLTPKLSVDATVFLNDYDRLVTVDMIGRPSLVPTPAPSLSWNAVTGNQLQGQAHGFELAADYRPAETWRLQASYAYLDLNLKARPGNSEISPLRAEGESPRHQASLISRHDLRHDLELDLQARYVSALTTYTIPDYLTADVRLGWRATSRLDLALNGRNLIGPARKEFGTNIVNASDAYLIPREYYLTANLRF